MRRICCCFALALGLPLGALGAQETPAVAAGTRVRVTAPDGWRDVGPGSLEAIDSATIVVRRANGTTVAFPRERGTQLEVSWGPGACSGGARRGGCIALGFLGGAALGIPAGFVWVRSSNCRELCGLAFVVTVPAGAVLGTIVGAVVGGEHWRPVEPPARISVGPLGAQKTPAVAAGTRVRVTAPDGWRDVGPGSLEAIDSATIVVRRANGTTVAFPRERGTRLEVSGGPGACSGGHRGGCVALGFLGGAALGVLAPVVSSATCRRLVCGLFVVTVPAGVVLGTIVGAVVGGEHWRTVEPPARISVGPLGAQKTPAVAAGTRVRVTAPDGWRDVGPGSL